MDEGRVQRKLKLIRVKFLRSFRVRFKLFPVILAHIQKNPLSGFVILSPKPRLIVMVMLLIQVSGTVLLSGGIKSRRKKFLVLLR